MILRKVFGYCIDTIRLPTDWDQSLDGGETGLADFGAILVLDVNRCPQSPSGFYPYGQSMIGKKIIDEYGPKWVTNRSEVALCQFVVLIKLPLNGA
jgi:hypothetical protein